MDADDVLIGAAEATKGRDAQHAMNELFLTHHNVELGTSRTGQDAAFTDIGSESRDQICARQTGSLVHGVETQSTTNSLAFLGAADQLCLAGVGAGVEVSARLTHERRCHCAIVRLQEEDSPACTGERHHHRIDFRDRAQGRAQRTADVVKSSSGRLALKVVDETLIVQIVPAFT